MRSHRSALTALFLCTLPIPVSGQQTIQQPVLALTDVTVIDGTGAPPMPGMTIVLEQDRIATLFRTAEREPPAGAIVRKLNGHFVMPGLIDAHVHLFASVPTSTDSAAVAELFARERARIGRVLRGGVTTVRNMAGRCRQTRQLAQQVERGEVESAEPYFGAVVIGPAGHSFPGMQRRQLEEAVAEFQRANPGCRRVIDGPFEPQELIAAAKATGATGVKLYGDLSAEVAQQIAEEAHRQGLMVWAHATLFPARPSELVRGGVDVLSHAGHLIWEAVDSLPGFAPREGPPGPFELVSPSDPAMEELFRLMAERGTILDPTLLFYQLLATAPDTAGQISSRDRMARSSWAVNVTRRAWELGVPIAAGTDAMGAEEDGSLPNLHRELELLVSQVGLSPLEAIAASTSVAAQALGLENEMGTITVGKRADLVVLRSDPTVDIRNTRDIAFVVKRGRVISAAR
jgi:imidazolonepropionase-like amidohydrolase